MSEKRRLGDRRDGRLLRDIDAMHFIMPLIYPNRCDNEAFISERIDLTNLNLYLEKKNASQPEYKYNIFQTIVTAVLKTIALRPKMNRFIANKNMYQRRDISAAFVVKKIFSDSGEEGLALVKADKSSTINTIHDEIYRQVSFCRNSEQKDGSSESMDLFNKMPRFLSKFLVGIVRILDRYGRVPRALIASDPYYSSVILTNLGSIKLHSGYHHLTNWGTTSLFVIVGERKLRPFYDENGSVTMRDSIDLGLTVDERIADGYYFSKTVRILKKLLENPELLEDSFGTELEL